MRIVIMAGGKGTRIAEINSQVPKPMIPIDGKPILEYQIESLKKQGYDDIILMVGHLGHVIQDYFKDGAALGVKIEYVVEEDPLGTAGAYIDDIFYCPHHPHKGYEGERPEFKMECECRKPKPGMLLLAAEKYNIDLSASYMIGDGANDIEAGRAAGCKVCALGNLGMDGVKEYAGLSECVEDILKSCKNEG